MCYKGWRWRPSKSEWRRDEVVELCDGADSKSRASALISCTTEDITRSYNGIAEVHKKSLQQVSMEVFVGIEGCLSCAFHRRSRVGSLLVDQ